MRKVCKEKRKWEEEWQIRYERNYVLFTLQLCITHMTYLHVEHGGRAKCTAWMIYLVTSLPPYPLFTSLVLLAWFLETMLQARSHFTPPFTCPCVQAHCPQKCLAQGHWSVWGTHVPPSLSTHTWQDCWGKTLVKKYNYKHVCYFVLCKHLFTSD